LQIHVYQGSDYTWLNAIVLAWFIEHHRVCIRVHMKAFLLHRKAALAARATKIVGVGLILTDHTTKIVFVNNAWCNITGYTADEVVGKEHGSKPVDRSSHKAGTYKNALHLFFAIGLEAHCRRYVYIPIRIRVTNPGSSRARTPTRGSLRP